jgi:hypothetical protein
MFNLFFGVLWLGYLNLPTFVSLLTNLKTVSCPAILSKSYIVSKHELGKIQSPHRVISNVMWHFKSPID